MRVALTVIEGPHAGRSFSFDEHDSFLVGRGSKAHFRLPQKDPHFSRLHFLIEINPPCCRLMDLESTNGTFVNNRPVRIVDLHDGDRIQGGNTVLRVSIEAPAIDPAATTLPPGMVRAPAKPSGDNAARDEDRSSVSKPGAQAGDASIAPAERTPVRLPPGQGGLPPATALWESDLGLSLDEGAVRQLPPDYVQRIREFSQPFDGYLIIDEIGFGGMGVVYRAIRKADRSVVALKTITPVVAGSPADLQRFQREAEILGELHHPNIVSFRDVGQADGILYIATDYVQGSDVSQLLREHDGPLPVHVAVDIICQLLLALDYAHAKGFVHRDIKPANLLISTDGGKRSVRLTDFGLARTYHASRLSGLTLLGEVAGTAYYMAPEQITDYRDSKPPVDQYSSAATLYHLLTNAHVYDFPSESTRQLLLILHNDPVPIRARRPDLPEELATVIHRGLAREPADRFADVGKMRRALLPFAAAP